LTEWELAAFAVGFLVVGYGAGLVHYHFATGFFLSLRPGESIQFVLATAEARILRRKAKLLPKPPPRHLQVKTEQGPDGELHPVVTETSPYEGVREGKESRKL
jgi:hypothetical protein